MIKQLNSLLLLLLFTFSVLAQNPTQIYIEGDDIGQGFSVKRLNLCYFIAPNHVVAESVFLTLKGSDNLRSLGDGQTLQPFGYDLAVGHIAGSLSNQCGIEFNALSVNQTDIDKAKTVVVSTVNADGLISRTPAVVQETGLIYLTISPQDEKQIFYKGMSGSLVYAQGNPIGMLQSVESGYGFGKVLRLDRLIETTAPFFSSSLKQPTVQKIQTESSQTVEFIVSYWNLPPTSNELSAQLISDQDKNTYYETQLQGTAELDLSFEAHKDIKGIRLSLPNNSGIKDIEVLVSRKKSGKRGWISSASNTVLPSNKEVIINLQGVKAQRVKLKIYSSWNDEGLIRISEVQVF